MRIASTVFHVLQRRMVCVAAALLLVVSCSEQATQVIEPPREPPGGTSAAGVSVVILSGHGQLGEAGQLLEQPIKIRALDRSGEPVRGVRVYTPIRCELFWAVCPTIPGVEQLRVVSEVGFVATGSDGTAEFQVRAPDRFSDFAEYEGSATYNRLALSGVSDSTRWLDLGVKVRAASPVRSEWIRPSTLDLAEGEAIITRLRYLDALDNEIHPARYSIPSVAVADPVKATVAVARGAQTGLPPSWASARLAVATTSYADWILLTGRAAGATTMLIDHATGPRGYPVLVLPRRPVVTELILPDSNTGEAWKLLRVMALRDAAVVVARRGSSIYAMRTFGDSLRIMFGPVPFNGTENVITSSARGDTVAWSYDQQVFVSRDGGREWTMLPSPPFTFFSVSVERGGEVIAARDRPWMVSRTSTGTWQTDTLSGPLMAFESIGTYLFAKSEYAQGEDRVRMDGLYRHPPREDGLPDIRTPITGFAHPKGYAFAGDTLLFAAQEYRLVCRIIFVMAPCTPGEESGQLQVVAGLPRSEVFASVPLPSGTQGHWLTQAGDGSTVLASYSEGYFRKGSGWESVSLPRINGSSNTGSWSTSTLAWIFASGNVWRVELSSNEPRSP